MTPRQERHASTEPTEAADSSEAALRNDPTDSTDSVDPTEPIDRVDPTEPIDNVEPVLAMDRMLPRERHDSREREESIPARWHTALVPVLRSGQDGAMTSSTDPRPAHASGTFTLGASSSDPMTVHRLGYGAMRITGPGIWGDPPDRAEAVRVLRRAVELGVDFIDTADSYGPFVSEELIREALHPYDGVVVATKGGLLRTGPDKWHVLGDPTYLRQCVEMSLRRLDVERIDLWQLHRIDARYPVADQIGVLAELQGEGKIAHLGLSQVSVDDLIEARRHAEIVTVQNLYNLVDRSSEDLLDFCDDEGVGFIPWFPVATGQLAAPGGPLDALAEQTGHTPAQLALAWLLARSGVTLPIPGTGSVAHLEENVAAAEVALDRDTVAALEAMAGALPPHVPRA